ncbi:MAG: hypothetical protein H7145_19640, partial [Akkermansiaceae bacterium]|nr:hypothetical protein [Armatimonadota bacterium]
ADTMVQCALFGSGNKFEASGKANFSKNLWPVDLSQDRPRQTVEVRATSPGGTTKTKLPIRTLYPVAVYNLHPSAAGDSLRDGEGLTVGDDGTFALLADDDTPAIWRLDFRTAALTKVFAPVKGGSIKGPEGLTRGTAPGEYLMSDDDGAQILTLSFGADGKLEEKKRESTKDIFGYPEGIEMVGESLAFVGNSQLLLVDAATRQPRPGFPVKYDLKPFGSHTGGVGYDGVRLWLTAAGYTKASQQNDRSLLLNADATSGAIREAYSLGEYASDPRSVSIHDGLVYVIDGYATPTLPGGTEPNRLGVKVFVFSLTPIGDPMAMITHFPLRRK